MKKKTVQLLFLTAGVTVIIWIIFLQTNVLVLDHHAAAVQKVHVLQKENKNSGITIYHPHYDRRPVKLVKIKWGEVEKIKSIRRLKFPPSEKVYEEWPVNDVGILKDEEENESALKFTQRTFYLKGMPLHILSGSVHYFRVFPEHWADRLRKLKACGFNTVETYVAWNLHEPSPGAFDFTGILNIRKFIQMAHDFGLYVILRPGPYICSELDFGGLPGWLLHDPRMVVRTNYPGYVTAVNRYFSRLIPMVYDLQFTEGGPIIMVQVENEYGSYGRSLDHMKLLIFILRRLGIRELLVTVDSRRQLDFSQYALPTLNLAAGKFEQSEMVEIQSRDEDFPLMVMEFWCGWFTTWGEKAHVGRLEKDVIKSLTKILEANASVNIYMFAGGTNFGFSGGSLNVSGYAPFITSYDYDGLLTEAGDITTKYVQVRNVLREFHKAHGVNKFPQVPPDTPKADYGTIRVEEVMEWDVFMTLLPVVKTVTQAKHMETFKDHRDIYSTMGYIVYSYNLKKFTMWNKMQGIQVTGMVRDRLMAIANGELFYILHGSSAKIDPFLDYDWDKVFQSDPYEYKVDYVNVYDDLLLKSPKIPRTVTKMQASAAYSRGRLDLVVENMGRVSYSPQGSNLMNEQRKGLTGPLFRYIFGYIDQLEIRPINFNQEQHFMLTNSELWVKLDKLLKQAFVKTAPAVFRAYLTIKGSPCDTFLKMDDWRKGVVLINGFNLGRYWNIGPQKKLFVPGPLLKTGKNEIIIFEEERWGRTLSFTRTNEYRKMYLKSKTVKKLKNVTITTNEHEA